MPSCVVKSCRNHSGTIKKRQGITFHRFPSANDVWKNDWVQIIRDCRNENNWNPSKSSVICSIHFEENDLYTTKGGLLRVVAYAVPKKFLFETSSMQEEQPAEASTSSAVHRSENTQTPSFGSSIAEASTSAKSAPKRRRRQQQRQHESDSSDSSSTRDNEADHAVAEHANENAGHQGHQFRCNECFCNVFGFRYTCVQCSDWELCGQCEQRGAHAHHYVLRVPTNATHAEIKKVKNTIIKSLTPVFQETATLQKRPQENIENTPATVKKEITTETEVKQEVEDEEYNFKQQDLNMYPESSPDYLSSLPTECEVKVEYENTECYPDPLKLEEPGSDKNVILEHSSFENKISKGKPEPKRCRSNPIKLRGVPAKNLGECMKVCSIPTKAQAKTDHKISVVQKPAQRVQDKSIVQKSQSEESPSFAEECGVPSAHGGTPNKNESVILGEPTEPNESISDNDDNICHEPDSRKRKLV